MEENPKKSENNEKGTKELNENEIKEIEPKDEKSKKTNSNKNDSCKKQSTHSKKTFSISSKSEENKDNVDNQTKSNQSQKSKSKFIVNKCIDNNERYKEVLKSINDLENKLDNQANNLEEIPKFIDESKKNNDIKNLKAKLLNAKNDEDNLVYFFKKIDGLLSNRKYQNNDKIFEEKVTELFAKKYDLTKFNSFPFINYTKSREETDYTTLIDFFKINIDDFNKRKEYLFFKDRGYFPITYNNLFLLFEKDSKGFPNNLTIFSHNYKYITQYNFEKFGQKYILPIFKSQLTEEFLEIESKINELNSKLLNYIDDKQNNKNKKEKGEEKEKVKEDIQKK